MPISKEAKVFVFACEAIHRLVDQGPLTPDDQNAIELTGMALLSKVVHTEDSLLQ